MSILTLQLASEIFITVSTFLASAWLGLGVFLRNSKSWTNRLFAALAFLICVYAVVHFLSLHPPASTPANQLLWIRIDMSVGAFLGPLLFLLVYNFPKNEFKLKIRYLIFLAIFAIVTAILSLTPLVFKSIEYPNGQPLPIPGPGIIFYFFDFIGLIALSFLVLFLHYKKSVREEKDRLIYVLWGALGTFSIMGISTLIFVVLLKTSVAVFWGPASFLIFAAFIAYAIKKRVFLDVRPTIARAVSSVAAIVAISIAYALVVFLVAGLIAKIPLHPQYLLISTISAALLVFTFQPLQKKIKKLTNKIFFNGLYDFEVLISDLLHIMIETSNLGELTKKLLNAIMSEMKISKAAFLIIDNHRIKDIRGIGYNEKDLFEPVLEAQIHRKIKSKTHSFVIQELEDEKMRKVFQKYEVEVLIPIKIEKKEVAILILGPKNSNNAYSSRDLNLLDVFASGAGTAIQNARLYVDLKLALEANSQFLNVVSHQLRASLGPMRWTLEVLMKDSSPTNREKLSEVNKTVVNLTETINDLLSATRIEAGGLSVKKEQTDLEKIILDEIAMFKPTADAKGTKIVFNQAGEMGLVIADKRILIEAFKNILDNAIIYAPGDSRIQIFIEQKDNEYIVSVQNEGQAIPESEQEKIFTKFYRGEEAKRLNPSGSGLGLFVAKSTLEAMGGKIWFRSPAHENTGVIFYISVPRA